MGYILREISMAYGKLQVFKGFNMEIEDNKVVCILGPSGCGKTTLLNLIAGLSKPSDGEMIGFDNKRISYIFQDDRLIKWKTVYENIDFVLTGIPIGKRNNLIKKYLDITRLWE